MSEKIPSPSTPEQTKTWNDLVRGLRTKGNAAPNEALQPSAPFPRAEDMAEVEPISEVEEREFAVATTRREARDKSREDLNTPEGETTSEVNETPTAGSSPVASIAARRRQDLDMVFAAHRAGEPNAAAEAVITPEVSVETPSATNEPDAPLRAGMDDPHDSPREGDWEAFLAREQQPSVSEVPPAAAEGAIDTRPTDDQTDASAAPEVTSGDEALLKRTKRQVDFFRNALDADLKNAGETASEARKGDDTALPGYKDAANAIGVVRKEITKQEAASGNTADPAAVHEKRTALAQALRTHRNEARARVVEKKNAEKAKITEAITSATLLRDTAQKRFDAVRESTKVNKEVRQAAERELDLASLAHARIARRADAKGIDISPVPAKAASRRFSAEALIAAAKRRRAETFSTGVTERATKIMAQFADRRWGKRLGYAALLSVVASIAGNGERQGLIELSTVDAKELFEAKWNAALMTERQSAQAESRNTQATADTLPDTLPSQQDTPQQDTPSTLLSPDREASPTISLNPVPAVASAMVAGKTVDTSYTIDPLPRVFEPMSPTETVERKKEYYTITENCTLWDVLEGDTRIPQTSTFKKVGEASEKRLQALIDLVRNEIAGNPRLAEKAGLQTENNQKLWLYTGDVLTSAHLEVIEGVAARIAREHGFDDEGDLDTELKNVPSATTLQDLRYETVDTTAYTPAEVSELSYGAKDTGPATTGAAMIEEQTEKIKNQQVNELPKELRLFEMPKNPSNPEQKEPANFGNEMYHAYLAGDISGISLQNMSRPAFLERQNLFLGFARQYPEIAQAMNVPENDFSKIKPGDEVDIGLWYSFMTDPNMRLSDLRSKAMNSITKAK